MVLLQSLWGMCLAGKIPGSVKEISPSTVSTLTISHVSVIPTVIPQNKTLSASEIIVNDSKDVNNFDRSVNTDGIELSTKDLDIFALTKADDYLLIRIRCK